MGGRVSPAQRQRLTAARRKTAAGQSCASARGGTCPGIAASGAPRRLALGSEANSICVYGCCGARNSARARPISTISPAYITATRSASCATTPRSCVMSRIAMPRSACRRRSSSRICAWMVTSSAVVASSAISTSGSAASAAAIITRWRSPPESWNGYSSSRRAASGMPTASSSSSGARARGRRPLWPRWRSITSMICRPTVSTGLSEVAGSWKIIATRRPRTARIATSGSASRSCSSSRTEPPAMRPAARQQAHDRQRGHRLAAARFADQREALAAPQLEADAVDRVHRCRAGRRARCAGLRPRARRRRARRDIVLLRSRRPARADRSRRAPHRQAGWPTAPA